MRVPIPQSFVLLLISTPLFSAPVFQMKLVEAETKALDHSPLIQALRNEADAAHYQTKNQFATLWPRLSFDVTYRYVTEIPSFRPVPTGPATEFGDHKNYSYGPAANWLMWDSGGVYNRWKSAAARERSKRNELDAAERQLRLETRLNYFQAQLGLEQVGLLADSMKLAQAQYKDIYLRQKAGASSRIDSLASHQEVLNRSRQFRQAQADLANALESLFTVTGTTPPASASIPLESSLANSLPADTEPPTLLVNFDPLVLSASILGPAAQRPFDTTHPQIQALAELVDASERNAKSVRAGHFPFLQLTAKTSRDYPNGPVRESIHQNLIGVSAGISLFEFGRLTNAVAEQESLTKSYEKRREQTWEDLETNWQKARDQWLGLVAQQKSFQQSIRETETLQTLTYESYQAGQSTFLEVQTANLRVLESKVASARNDTQLLIQLAILDSLSSKE